MCEHWYWYILFKNPPKYITTPIISPLKYTCLNINPKQHKHRREVATRPPGLGEAFTGCSASSSHTLVHYWSLQETNTLLLSAGPMVGSSITRFDWVNQTYCESSTAAQQRVPAAESPDGRQRLDQKVEDNQQHICSAAERLGNQRCHPKQSGAVTFVVSHSRYVVTFSSQICFECRKHRSEGRWRTPGIPNSSGFSNISANDLSSELRRLPLYESGKIKSMCADCTKVHNH